MSDLIDDPKDGLNDPEFTVSEISGAIKRLIEGEFSHVRLKGEIGRVSFPRSGHVYLDLKDEKAVISAVIWKGVAARLQIQPEEGMEVVATGRVTTFGGQSKYQLVIEQLKPAGVGALMAMLEKRKAALAAEGLFQTSHKKQIPYLPEVIGVVTSPSGRVTNPSAAHPERRARLACVRPAASVRSEPGSNSQVETPLGVLDSRTSAHLPYWHY